MTETDGSPGWAAIDAALERLYPNVEPRHLGTVIPWSLGGPDPLDGISFYPRADHWHAVTYGISELYEKTSSDVDESGWGFEFTIRIARTPDEEAPPVWAAQLLQNLARYVFGSGNPFGPGHRVSANGPIRLDRPETALRALGFTVDPELAPIDTPHGRLTFLQVVGLTLDEYEAAGRWDMDRLLELLAQHLPLLITDVDRASLVQRPEIAAAVAAGIERDGSATGSLFIADLSWRHEPASAETTAAIVVRIGANAVENVAQVVPGRLPHGHGLLLEGSQSSVGLLPAGEFGVTDHGNGFVEIGLPSDVAAEFISVLRPTAGLHRLGTAPGLVVEIVKSQIRDQSGNVVTEIG